MTAPSADSPQGSSQYRFSLAEPEYRPFLQWLSPMREIYDVISFIAQGGQGKVFKALYKNLEGNMAEHEEYSTKQVALKVTTKENRFDTDFDTKNFIKNAQREIDNIQLAKKADLPYVVKYFSVGDNRDDKSNNTYRSFIVMQIAPMCLEHFIPKSIYIRAELCYHAALGLDSLHKLKIFHRDIKPENYLVVKSRQGYFTAKLTDLGCSRKIGDNQNLYRIPPGTVIGTARYLAPEVKDQQVAKQEDFYFGGQDIFSFCLSLLEMLFGVVFLSDDTTTMIDEAFKAKRDLSPSNFDIKMPNLEKADKLVQCIAKGLKFRSKNRYQDMSEIISILQTYDGYQQKKCKFSHDKYYNEILCLTNNQNVDNIDVLLWENELMTNIELANHPEPFGSAVMKATYRTGYVVVQCVLKMLKAKTPLQRQRLWRFIQQCKALQEVYDSRLIRIYDVPKIYRYLFQPDGNDFVEITNESEIMQGEYLLGFIFLQEGASIPWKDHPPIPYTMAFRQQLQKKIGELNSANLSNDINMSPTKNQSLKELKKDLEAQKNLLARELDSLTMRNRLQISYRIFEILRYLHGKNISVGSLSPQHIMMFLTGTTYTPKLIRLETFSSNCSVDQKLNDLKLFKDLFDELVVKWVKPLPHNDGKFDEEEEAEYQEMVRDRRIIEDIHTLFSREFSAPKLSTNFIGQLENRLRMFKTFEPCTYANTVLETMCNTCYFELKSKLKRVKEPQPFSTNFRIQLELEGALRDAHIEIFDMRKPKNATQEWTIYQEKVKNEIEVINAIKRAKFKGLLEYYEAVWKPGKAYAYIITEEYRSKCDNVKRLKETNEIRPEDLIGNFKDIFVTLKELHRLKISHMNIVPSSFYVVGKNEQRGVKLGSFGLSLTPSSTKALFLWQPSLRLTVTQENWKSFVTIPPEYLLPNYPIEARFASDIWMIGTSLVVFGCGEEALSTIEQLVSYIKKPIDNEHSKSRIRAASMVGRHIDSMREILLRLNWQDRGGEDFIQGFLTKMLDYRTVVAANANEKAMDQIRDNLTFLEGAAEMMQRLSYCLEHVLIREGKFFQLGIRKLIPEVMSWSPSKQAESWSRYFTTIPTQHYTTQVNSWLYMLSYLEVSCLKRCVKLCDQGMKTNLAFQDQRTKFKERRNIVGRQLSNYHEFLERYEPDLPMLSRQKQYKEIFKQFKSRLVTLFMLFRRYVLETYSSFTPSDILILQGLYMSYTVEEYLMLQDNVLKTRPLTGYTQIQALSFDNLVTQLRELIRRQQQRYEQWRR